MVLSKDLGQLMRLCDACLLQLGGGVSLLFKCCGSTVGQGPQGFFALMQLSEQLLFLDMVVLHRDDMSSSA